MTSTLNWGERVAFPVVCEADRLLSYPCRPPDRLSQLRHCGASVIVAALAFREHSTLHGRGARRGLDNAACSTSSAIAWTQYPLE